MHQYHGQYVGYLKNTYTNLKEIDSSIELNNLYVQNLHREYDNSCTETSKLNHELKKKWQERCKYWGSILIDELNNVYRIPKDIPVFLTSYDLIKPLLCNNTEFEKYDAKLYYFKKFLYLMN